MGKSSHLAQGMCVKCENYRLPRVWDVLAQHPGIFAEAKQRAVSSEPKFLFLEGAGWAHSEQLSWAPHNPQP